jgi:hypothetical protein
MINILNLDTLALIGGTAVIAAALVYWHLSKETDFDLRWVLVDTSTGKVSLYKVGQATALMVSTWVLVHETRAGTLSEWLFAAYMFVWTGANIANKMVNRDAPNPTT